MFAIILLSPKHTRFKTRFFDCSRYISRSSLVRFQLYSINHYNTNLVVSIYMSKYALSNKLTLILGFNVPKKIIIKKKFFFLIIE